MSSTSAMRRVSVRQLPPEFEDEEEEEEETGGLISWHSCVVCLKFVFPGKGIGWKVGFLLVVSTGLYFMFPSVEGAVQTSMFLCSTIGLLFCWLAIRLVCVVIIKVGCPEGQYVASFFSVVDPAVAYLLWAITCSLVWRFALKTTADDAEGAMETEEDVSDEERRASVERGALIWLILWTLRDVLVSLISFWFSTGIFSYFNEGLVNYLKLYSLLRRLNAGCVGLTPTVEDESMMEDEPGAASPTEILTPRRDATEDIEGGAKALPPTSPTLMSNIGLRRKKKMMEYHVEHTGRALPKALRKKAIKKTKTSGVLNLSAFIFVQEHPMVLFVHGCRIEIVSKTIAKETGAALYEELLCLRQRLARSPTEHSFMNERTPPSSKKIWGFQWFSSVQPAEPPRRVSGPPPQPHEAPHESTRPHWDGKLSEDHLLTPPIPFAPTLPVIEENSPPALAVIEESPHGENPEAEAEPPPVSEQLVTMTRETITTTAEGEVQRRSVQIIHDTKKEGSAAPEVYEITIQSPVPSDEDDTPEAKQDAELSPRTPTFSRDTSFHGAAGPVELPLPGRRTSVSPEPSSAAGIATEGRASGDVVTQDLTKEILMIFLKEDEASDLMKAADYTGDGKITREDFVRVTVECYVMRKQLCGIAESQFEIRKIFARMASIILSAVLVILWLILMGLDLNTIIISGAAILSSIVLLLSSVYSAFIQSLMFIIFWNPYNIGDRIKIDYGETLIVKKVTTFYTAFETIGGKPVSCVHNSLISRTIVNESRSKQATFILSIDISTSSLSRIEVLRQHIEDHVKSRSSEFVKDTFHFYVVGVSPGHMVQINCYVTYVAPWWNWQKVWGAQSDLLLYIVRQCERLGLQYKLPIQRWEAFPPAAASPATSQPAGSQGNVATLGVMLGASALPIPRLEGEG